jgi:hypothetical protein
MNIMNNFTIRDSKNDETNFGRYPPERAQSYRDSMPEG